MESSNNKTETEKPGLNLDPNFTPNVINAMGPKVTPRTRQVMASMIQHIHDFARENEITVEEWMKGIGLVSFPLPLSVPHKLKFQHRPYFPLPSTHFSRHHLQEPFSPTSLQNRKLQSPQNQLTPFLDQRRRRPLNPKT